MSKNVELNSFLKKNGEYIINMTQSINNVKGYSKLLIREST